VASAAAAPLVEKVTLQIQVHLVLVAVSASALGMPQQALQEASAYSQAQHERALVETSGSG
jgi:hypothetical protein